MDYKSFWTNESYAVVGNSSRKKFPVITYQKLKSQKKAFPVDPAAGEIEGDETYTDLSALPEKVDAVVLELPPEETKEWIDKAATAGINNVWIHQRCDTPEAISLAQERDLNLLYGTCAVMYLSEGFSLHAFHGWINRLLGKY